MQAFMKSVKSAGHSKENALKTVITTQLSETVKDIQLSSIENNDSEEAKSSLCSIVEAMFLHGLRDTLAHRFRRALADIDQRPEPHFFSPLLVISHRQIIDQIMTLTQITTEIGQCRAWIRLALNDALLSSYLMTIQQNPSALKPYYNTYAYIRDLETLEVAQKLIEGVEAIKLSLPCNSSLLNTWPVPSLLLAGIWSPTLRSCPVAAGVDIAQSLQATSSVNSETSSIASLMSQNSGIGQIVLLNQEEALNIILAKHASKPEYEENAIPIPEPAATPRSPTPVPSQDEAEVTMPPNSFGNSLNRQSGWSFDENTIDVKEDDINEDGGSRVMECSYNALVETSDEIFAGSHIRTPDFRDVFQNLNVQSRDDEKQKFHDEVEDLPKENNNSIALTAQICLIAKEKGLDYQDYECSGCREPFLITTKPQVCSFTGDYFCDTCMAPNAIPIPARIIHNWDFRKYGVSEKAFNCLNEVKDHPLIDFKTANPYIYSAVEEMAKLQVLRNQLNYLRAYLYTCREPVIEELQKLMFPREYMYEHIHQYSISDLLQIKDGTLATQLEGVVKFGREHVLNCWLCSQKGFLCEKCDQSKALFPFDTENVYRCNVCSGVYHKSCLNAHTPCPRCKRKKERDDLPLLE